MKTCQACGGEIQDTAVKCKHCKADLPQPTATPATTPDSAPQATTTTPASTAPTKVSRTSPLFGGAVLGVLLITALGVWLAPRVFKADGHVLIIHTTEDKNESHGIDKLARALKDGGHLKITVDEIRDRHKNFEKKYAITDSKGNYLIQGAVINFVVDRGWRFRSRDFGALVFVRE